MDAVTVPQDISCPQVEAGEEVEKNFVLFGDSFWDDEDILEAWLPIADRYCSIEAIWKILTNSQMSQFHKYYIFTTAIQDSRIPLHELGRGV